MRIVVTGGSGFIGTNLIEHFVEKGIEAINIDISPPRNREHMPYWRKVDLLDAEGLREVIQEFKPDYILHMGARTDLDGRDVSDYPANTLGVQNVISAVEGLASLRRIVFASSRLVCRIGYSPTGSEDYCPTTAYGESKVMGERLVHDATHRIPCSWVIVRPTSIWGMWFEVPYKTFFMSIAKGRYVHPGRAEILKSFGFIGNTVYELDKLLEAPDEWVDKKTLYLADYPPVNVATMANAIQREFEVAPIREMNVRVLRVAAWVGDVLKSLGWQQAPLTTFRLNNLLTPMIHDLEPLKMIAGELPYTMDDGVRQTVRWMKSRGNIS